MPQEQLKAALAAVNDAKLAIQEALGSYGAEEVEDDAMEEEAPTKAPEKGRMGAMLAIMGKKK